MVDNIKRRAIFDYYRKNADLLVVCESHSSEEIERIWESEWGGPIVFSHGSSQSKGIMICIKKQYENMIKNVYSKQGRLIIFDVEENEQKVSVVALYAPNQDNPSFFENIRELLKNRSEHKVMIGDFNLTLDIELDRQGTYFNNNKARDTLEDVMEQYCLRDIWRVYNPDSREMSWRKSGNISKGSRIDLALVSGGLDQNAQWVQYLPGIKTDHRAIYVLLELNPFERGRGYWKFNNTLLKDKEFLDFMNQEIEKIKVLENCRNPSDIWEKIKERIKKTSINYSRNKHSEDQVIIGNLSEKLMSMRNVCLSTRKNLSYIKKTKNDLDEKMFERAKGIMFRSKAKWCEEGEKNTKYFFSLEKARYNSKTCYKLLTDNGIEISNPEQILQIQKSFYEDLYQEDSEVKFTMKNTFGIVVPEEIKRQQDSPIVMEEIEKAIITMNNNKTPGQDGIPIDFYKVFWKCLKVPYFEMVKHSYEQEMLHETARKGILNLIPKANKDTRLVKNLRPITLLNVDYKIIEKVVANKMIPALETIIHKDQRGFMKDRRISVNIRKMLDIMHHVEQEDLEAVILSLDFVKCFDKCSFSILHGSLEFFGFGEVVKKWTEILYKDFTVKVQNNGHFSERIEIKKGVHQGGCCSSVYFLVIAEILALSLRANEDIEGITIQDIKHLLNQFADDMDISSLNSEKSIKAVYEELDKFKYQSGFTISYDKTTMYRIGSLRFSDAQLYGMSEVAWSNQDITVLGVTITHQDIISKNYMPIIDKVKKILDAWYNRGLSLIGKIQVVNTLVASLFVYKMMVLPLIPDRIIKIVDTKIRDYIWGGKKSKISYKVLQNPKNQGGLNLVDLKKRDIALKATWPQILHSEPNYASLVYQVMRCSVIQEDIWRCNIEPHHVKHMKIKSEFWRDVVFCWSSYNGYKELRIENQFLWYNSKILVRGRPIMWKDAYVRGLKYVYQLFNNKCFKTDDEIFSEYGLTKLRFNSLKVSIPSEWKNFLLETDAGLFMPIPPHNYDVSLWSKNTSSVVYAFLQEDVLLVHDKYLKWRMELGESICQGICEFGKKHQDIFKITNIAKYRSFQYRLLQRGLVTNVQLEKWGVISTNLCYFCNKEKETILHLMYACEHVQLLWDNLAEYVFERYGDQELSLDPISIILNEIHPHTWHVVNFICLIVKQFIYRQRCLKKLYTFPF